MTRTISIAAVILFCSSALAEERAAVDVIEDFFEAYNDHDIPAVLEFVHEDIGVHGVDGATIETWSSGSEALAAMLQVNFNAFESVRSELVQKQAGGKFVSIVEKALWDVDGETRQQCSMSVYEVRDGRLANVWYYPEQPCD